MGWGKQSDKSGTHPLLAEVAELPDADERSVNEVSGFIWRLAAESAAHETDYFVTRGWAQMMGGPRWAVLLEQALAVGLIVKVAVDGRDRLKLVEDAELIHIRSKAEVAWDRRRVADNRNTHITVHVRRRDGDNCRYCRVLVYWPGKTGPKKGTYDHRVPGQGADTADDLYVACLKCNSARQDDPVWLEDHPLLPPPEQPNYGPFTAKWLTDNGYPTTPNTGTDPQALAAPQAPQGAPLAAEPATQGGAPHPTPPAASTASQGADSSRTGSVPDESSGNNSGVVGSGREGHGSSQVGKGPDGTGRDGAGRDGAPPPPRRRRRRGRRGRGAADGR